MKAKLSFLLFVVIGAVTLARAQESFFAEDAGSKYWIKTNVVYGVENGQENKLDVISMT